MEFYQSTRLGAERVGRRGAASRKSCQPWVVPDVPDVNRARRGACWRWRVPYLEPRLAAGRRGACRGAGTARRRRLLSPHLQLDQQLGKHRGSLRLGRAAVAAAPPRGDGSRPAPPGESGRLGPAGPPWLREWAATAAAGEVAGESEVAAAVARRIEWTRAAVEAKAPILEFDGLIGRSPPPPPPGSAADGGSSVGGRLLAWTLVVTTSLLPLHLGARRLRSSSPPWRAASPLAGGRPRRQQHGAY